jgi:hypothetical protein
MSTVASAYGGVYRARCVSVLSDHAVVTVGQLYGLNQINVYEFAGSRPSAGDYGWVSFENERAERPIWMGAESKAYGGTAGPAGPQGPAGATGPAGPPGPGGGSFRFVQVTPAATWTIVHNLGYYPNVTTVDSSHREVVGEITYTDINTVTVTFSAGGVPSAFGGECYCS